jgi:manganese peroxidase
MSHLLVLNIFLAQFFIETLLHGTLFPGTPNNFGEVESSINGTLRLASDALVSDLHRSISFLALTLYL